MGLIPDLKRIEIGVSIATVWEFEAALEYFDVKETERTTYPYGEYFFRKINGTPVVFYSTGIRKVNGVGANQYMLARFPLQKVLVIGTCAGIDERFDILDILTPDRAVQYDCTVKEIEPLLKPSFIVEIDVLKYGMKGNGTIGTADRAVVMWNDYLELQANDITIADTEAAAIAYICRKNDVECIIIKGISDVPTDETDLDPLQSNQEQINVYIANTPKVMTRIFDDYLHIFI
ncbi:permease [Exiguobacterium sp. K1]|uniref:5'-methylthioadenosine/S-adenosylhomocysteine nucleosidase family protein n=1 Tax=Exiguobacterium sp. K1 TaxID=2980105 RepID=UPI00299EC546|nr:permease [Exiguobacterium sp. K1]MDX1259022.1 permease [Exiguobacterium sp. K1]